MSLYPKDKTDGIGIMEKVLERAWSQYANKEYNYSIITILAAFDLASNMEGSKGDTDYSRFTKWVDTNFNELGWNNTSKQFPYESLINGASLRTIRDKAYHEGDFNFNKELNYFREQNIEIIPSNKIFCNNYYNGHYNNYELRNTINQIKNKKIKKEIETLLYNKEIKILDSYIIAESTNNNKLYPVDIFLKLQTTNNELKIVRTLNFQRLANELISLIYSKLLLYSGTDESLWVFPPSTYMPALSKRLSQGKEVQDNED